MSEREFSSLTSFVMHLATVELAVHKAEAHALKKVAKLIETDAKNRIGEYQAQEGHTRRREPGRREWRGIGRRLSRRADFDCNADHG